MKRSLHCLSLALALELGILPAMAQLAAGDRLQQDGVSSADVNRMVLAVQELQPFLVKMWREMVPNAVLYRSPYIEAFYATIPNTPCGEVEIENAEYCKTDNTIYYDAIFLAKISKGIELSSGSRQNYGGIAIIEHEFGHAIAWRREPMRQGLSVLLASKYGAPRTYERERYADCVMGALTARAKQLGILPEYAEIEARLTAAAGGDWEAHERDHGGAIDRAQNFDEGYRDGEGGIGYCQFISRDEVLRNLVRGGQ